MALIHEKIADVFQEIGLVGVPKDKIMQKYNYRFRDIDSIMNILNPILGKHGVFLEIHTKREQRIIEREKMVTVILDVTYKLIAKDGSSVQSTVLGEGCDTLDKATAKAYSSAIKTFLIQMFMIPTESLWKEEEERNKSLDERAYEFLKNIEDDLHHFIDLDIQIMQELYDREIKPKLIHKKMPDNIKTKAIELLSKIQGLVLAV